MVVFSYYMVVFCYYMVVFCYYMVVFCLYDVKVRFKMLTEFQVPDLNYLRKTVLLEYLVINLMIDIFFFRLLNHFI